MYSVWPPSNQNRLEHDFCAQALLPMNATKRQSTGVSSHASRFARAEYAYILNHMFDIWDKYFNDDDSIMAHSKYTLYICIYISGISWLHDQVKDTA